MDRLIPDGPARGDPGRIRKARQDRGLPQPVPFPGGGPAGGTGDLASGGPILQRPVAPRRTPAVLQRRHRRVRFRGERLPAADRGGMGIRLPGRDEFRLLVRRRSAAARRLRLVRRQLRQEDASRRPEEAQSVGPLRHARQRGRVVPGRLRPGLLQGQPGEEPARTGRRQGIRPPRRLMEIPRRRLAVGLPARREPRLLRRLPGPRRHRLPLRAQARRPRRMQDESRRSCFVHSSFRGRPCSSTPGSSSSSS